MSQTKPYHSPFRVTYDDLVNYHDERLKWMLANPRSGWHGQHELEVQKKTVALLKKFKKDPQINLFDEFEKIKP